MGRGCRVFYTNTNNYTTFVQLLICLLCDSWGDRRHDFSASQLTEGKSDRLTFDGSECWSDSASKDGRRPSSPTLPDKLTIGRLSSLELELSCNWIPKSLHPFAVPCLFSPNSLTATGEKDSVEFSILLDQYIDLLEAEQFPPKPRKPVAVELKLVDG